MTVSPDVVTGADERPQERAAATTASAAVESSPASLATERRDRRAALTVLGVSALAFALYSVVSLPRLTNAHFADIEFSGWSGPIGSRLIAGERPYIDFVLPIPPGSFALLAVVEWFVGRPLLLEELWLNAIIHLVMGGLAYLAVAPLTTRRTAVLVAVSTLATVVQLNKECAYDHTAQLVVWVSFVVAVRALLSTAPDRRRRLWFITGLLATFTLAFKQSTGVGVTLGWVGAFGYLFAAERFSGHRDEARRWLLDLRDWASGAGWGLMALWALLIVLGSTASAYFQAVFVDGAVLKGGTWLLLRHVATYLFTYPAYPGSLGVIVAVVLIGLRLLRNRGGLHAGDEPKRRWPLGWLEAAYIGAAVLIAFTMASVLLLSGVPAYPIEWVPEIDRLKLAPPVSLLFLGLFFVVHAVRIPPRSSKALVNEPERMGHALNALTVAALSSTLLHNTSAPEFRPFYDNNPIIFLAFMALYMALERASLRSVQALVLTLCLASLYGNKFFRTMTATIPVNEGHWAGMLLNDHGWGMAETAARARELTKPNETVLVLPEDLQLAAAIGRPRPPLLGAIVFVDQYAPRLADDDIARLDENLPKVIIVHPNDVRGWQRFFRIWSGSSGAERVLQHVLSDLLPRHYRLDRRVPTMFLWEPATLELYVRADHPAEKGEAPARPDEGAAPPSEEGEGASGEDARAAAPNETGEDETVMVPGDAGVGGE